MRKLLVAGGCWLVACSGGQAGSRENLSGAAGALVAGNAAVQGGSDLGPAGAGGARIGSGAGAAGRAPAPAGGHAGAAGAAEAGRATNGRSGGGGIPNGGGAAPAGASPRGGGAGDTTDAGGAGGAGGGGAGGTLACSTFVHAASSLVAVDELAETSGMALSRTQDVVWLHNDSSNPATLFAVGLDGTYLGSYDLLGAANVDWEDMALGPGPISTADYLYVADIGDQLAARTHVELYRIQEPAVPGDATPVRETLTGVEQIQLVYPDGDAADAEALFVDPETGDAYVMTKESDAPTRVYRASAPFDTSTPQELERVATVPFGQGLLSGPTAVTAADLSADGQWLVVRTTGSAFGWTRRGATISAMLESAACVVPLVAEQQGEAIAVLPDASGYYTTSEGPRPPLHRFLRVE